MIKSSAMDLEVFLHDTYCLLWANLLKLLAGSSLVAGKMMDSADGEVAHSGEVRTALSSGLRDHCPRVL